MADYPSTIASHSKIETSCTRFEQSAQTPIPGISPLGAPQLELYFKMADIDKWIDIAKECKYLPENDLKKLCDMVCDLLLEESNIQPVSTPVTVCGDIHGQVTVANSVLMSYRQVTPHDFLCH
ncbi:unnamed protein product [Timema podura]|uniref:Uncharacterized protein n=1 Tax=Timema podura TaxID=61482 RepID=A0ABN7PDE9_TIMPD|nr:unnamed protein product [Timema podura]